MKRCYIDLKTSGQDASHHGIIQISGIIEIDHTIMETFKIKCKPYVNDSCSIETMIAYDLTWNKWAEDSENLHPSEVIIKLESYLNKYVDRVDPLDKFQLVGYNVSEQMKFIRVFFARNGNKNFDSYFWFPALDVLHISNFILEAERYKFSNFSLGMVVSYFGFKIDEKLIYDPFYRVNLVRNLYYILEKFRVQKVLVKKASLN